MKTPVTRPDTEFAISHMSLGLDSWLSTFLSTELILAARSAVLTGWGEGDAALRDGQNASQEPTTPKSMLGAI